MAYIRPMNVSGLDLNLLKAFAALHEHRHVTRAGAAIGLAQPSMSNALSRLRALTGDALFVRAPGGMVPTPRADAMAPRVAQALALAGEAFADPAPFDPGAAQASVRIAAPDSVALTLAPALAARLAIEAPGIDLRFLPVDKRSLWAEMDRDAVDLAVGRLTDVPARFERTDGPRDEFVVISDGSGAAEMTLKRYCAAPHVLVSLAGDGRGAVDDALAALGRTRRVALVVAQFSVVPAVVARTGHLATIPASVAETLVRGTGCAVHPLPLDLPDWSLCLVSTARARADPAKRYVATVANEVLAGS